MKFKNIGKYSLYFVGYKLVCENIVWRFLMKNLMEFLIL